MVRNDVTNKFTFAGIAMKFEMNVRLNAATKLSFTLCLMTELLLLVKYFCVARGVSKYVDMMLYVYSMSGFCLEAARKRARREKQQ